MTHLTLFFSAFDAILSKKSGHTALVWSNSKIDAGERAAAGAALPLV